MNTVSPRQSLFARVTNSLWLPGLAIAASLAVATPLQAQDAPQSKSTPQLKSVPPTMTPEQSKQMKEIQSLHTEYMQLQKQLAQIQREALEAHPELKKQEQDLHDLVMAKMNSNGHNVKDEMTEINKLEEELKSTKTTDKERNSLMIEYQKKAMEFRNAQTQAMQNPDVKAAQQKLIDSVVSAMKEKDPKTEQLMKEMQQKGQQLSTLLKAAGHSE